MQSLSFSFSRITQFNINYLSILGKVKNKELRIVIHLFWKQLISLYHAKNLTCLHRIKTFALSLVNTMKFEIYIKQSTATAL